MVIIYIRYSSNHLPSTKSYDFRRSNGQRIQPHWVCNHIPFIGKWLFFNSRNHHKRKREIHTFMWRKKDYIVRASHIEYTTTFIAAGQSTNNMTFILEPSIISMEEIIIKSNFIKHEYDRIIVNMKGNPVVKGRTINEALGMLPGIINMNDELRLNGGTVSKIYINGRELHDRTELSSLQATDIENVEILPEADLQYNATTKGGIIYISLKKM